MTEAQTQRQPQAFDPLIPQTARAQKSERYYGPVPSYVRKTDAHAIAAGLIVSRRVDHSYGSSNICTYYTGTRETLKSAFTLGRFPRGLRLPARCKVPGYLHGESKSCYVFMVADDQYAVEVDYPLPNSSETLPGGAEKFVFNLGTYDECRSFLGTKEMLIAGADLSPDIFTEYFAEYGNTIRARDLLGVQVLIWEVVAVADGLWVFSQYPEHDSSAMLRAVREGHRGAVQLAADDAKADPAFQRFMSRLNVIK